MNAEQNFTRTMRIDLLLNDWRDTGRTTLPTAETHRIETLSQSVPGTDFEVLLQSIYDAALLTDFDGRVTNANERAMRFFGYTAEAITRHYIGDLIAGADANILETVIENVQSERFTLLQAHCIRQDESLFPAEISATCLKLAEATSLCFFIRDISVRREMEELLRIEHNAVQNAGSGIAITDPDGIIIYANPAMCVLWGRDTEDSLRSSAIHDLFCEPAPVTDAISRAATARTCNGELKACRQDGNAFYVFTSATRCVDDDDIVTHIVFSFVDTTRRRLDEEALRLYRDHLEDLIRERTAELETINNDLKRENAERLRVVKDLRDAIQQLREHDQARNMFVSNVSHELRTPLTTLIQAIESLMRGVSGPVPDAVLSYLTMMLDDCWRLNRTVCDILDLSRIEAGRLELNTSTVPLRHMVARTVESLRMQAEEVPLTLDMIADTDNGFVDCDAAKMERVISNIVNNAIKFTPPGGTVSVGIAQKPRNGIDGVCCRISDNGIGIPPAYISRVTERFFRVGEQVGGTGLGLAIAKEIIELHQGQLDIASPPPGADKGTQVVIWLPTTGPQQIMIVAHDEGVPHVLEPALLKQGYRISCYQNAQNALQVLHDGHHHIVIVDSTIPDMDGTEIVMHLKADPILRKLPVFLLAEDHPPPARSNILSSFNIPVFLKTDGMHDLIAAVEDAFLPKRIGVQEMHAP